MDSRQFIQEGLKSIEQWLSSQTEAKLNNDVAEVMSTVRSAMVQKFGSLPEITQICDVAERSLLETLLDRYLRRASEAFFARIAELKDGRG